MNIIKRLSVLVCIAVLALSVTACARHVHGGG
jgi:hypothetical protein